MGIACNLVLFANDGIVDDYVSRSMCSGYNLITDAEDYSYVHGFLAGAFGTMKDFLRTYT